MEDNTETGPSSVQPGNKVLFSVLSLFILVGSFVLGYLLQATLKDYVAQAQVSLLSSDPVAIYVEKGRDKEEELPNFEKKERVNILLLGIDQRSGETGPWRTDTMIVLTVDPATNTAGMLSIPRDLWVTIPGYGENKINTAHFTGDLEDYPGGGPALAKKTVRNFLGIPINYYIRVNFSGFERLIDAIGGVTVDVDQAIDDDRYPDGNYGYMEIHIPAGVQQMSGEVALQYVRSRHSTDDYDRSRRQQKLLLAIRDKVLGMAISVDRIPEILRIVGDTVQTDMTLTELTTLARLALEVDLDSIKTGAIDGSVTTSAFTPSGMWVAIPDRDAIRELRDDIFSSPSISPPTKLATDKNRLISEAARIQVLNGTASAGLAQRTAARLRDEGFQVVGFGNADRADYTKTLVVDLAQKTYTVQTLGAYFGLSLDDIIQREELDSEVDVRIILGQDYASTEPQS